MSSAGSSSSSSGPSNASRLLGHINAGRANHSLRTLDTQAEVSFSCLLGKDKALIDLYRNPLDMSKMNRFDRYTEAANSNHVHYYLRLYSVPRATLEKYKNDFSADKEWAQTVLDKRPGDKTLFIPYVGMTYKTTPQGRVKEDMDDPKWSRLKNITSLLPAKSKNATIIYELHRERVEAAMDVRKKDKYDEIEQNLIAIVFPYCLNSASGGYFYRWTPSEVFKSKLLQAAPSAKTLPTTSPAPDDLKGEIERQQKFNYDVFSNIMGQQSMATIAALDEVIEDAQNVLMHGDRVLSVLITKDIPLEAMKGGYAYNGNTAGGAARIEHQIRHHLVRGLSIPRLNFWQFTEVHRDIAVAAALLSQSFQVLRPILIVSHSSKVANILQADMLADNTATIDLLATIARDETKLDSKACEFLRGDISEWKELQHPAFMSVVGTLSIIRYGTEGNDCALHLPERHTGNIAYDPSMGPLYCELHYLCKAKYITACHAIVKYEQPLDSVERLISIKRFIEDTWKTPGSDGSPSLHDLFERNEKRWSSASSPWSLRVKMLLKRE